MEEARAYFATSPQGTEMALPRGAEQDGTTKKAKVVQGTSLSPFSCLPQCILFVALFFTKEVESKKKNMPTRCPHVPFFSLSLSFTFAFPTNLFSTPFSAGERTEKTPLKNKNNDKHTTRHAAVHHKTRPPTYQPASNLHLAAQNVPI
ncbi:hypothetical protein QOT17_020078 [Balamuthia mandrillaris]